MTEVYYFNYSLNQRAKFFSKFLRNGIHWGIRDRWEGGYGNLVSLSAFSPIPSSSRSRRLYNLSCVLRVSMPIGKSLENRKQACRMLYHERRCEAKGRRKREREERGWREEAGKVEGRRGECSTALHSTWSGGGHASATRSHARDHASALLDTCAQCARRGATIFRATRPVRWHRHRVRFIAAYAETAPFA